MRRHHLLRRAIIKLLVIEFGAWSDFSRRRLRLVDNIFAARNVTLSDRLCIPSATVWARNTVVGSFWHLIAHSDSKVIVSFVPSLLSFLHLAGDLDGLLDLVVVSTPPCFVFGFGRLTLCSNLLPSSWSLWPHFAFRLVIEQSSSSDIYLAVSTLVLTKFPRVAWTSFGFL